jgi:tRNA G18 (ribose-2'-O)-methylase SpoU
VPVIPLNGAADPRVADYAAVADPDLVRLRGLFVAEGRLVVRRLIEGQLAAVHSVLVSPAAYEELRATLDRLDAGIPIYVCPGQSFREITGFNIHRGCLALAVRPPQKSPGVLLAEARLVLMLESIANPDNVGGIFRNAAAFGVDAVLLNAVTADPLYRKSIRTSMGASLRVPFARLDWAECLSAVRAAGFSIATLTPRESAETLDRFAASRPSGRLALVLGHEGEGVSETTVAATDRCIRIPTSGDVDSLNVAVASGIALARLTRFASV